MLDQCVMIGATNINIPNCVLTRSNGSTYVDMFPIGYDHIVKIVRISSTNTNLLFESPNIPGGQYNITLSMFSSTASSTF